MSGKSRSFLFWLAFSNLISMSLTYYCPNTQDLNPCKCLQHDHAKALYPDIVCSNEEDLNLTSIFSKVSQDAHAIQQIYGMITIKNGKLTEITENAFGNLTFRVIHIAAECSSLKRIHSNAFSHQSGYTAHLYILAENIISGPSPYSFYDLVNSFHQLTLLNYKSQIGTLEEKLNENGIESITLRANEIKGSPFSRMKKIERIHLSSGGINHVSNGAFKVGNIKNIHVTKKLLIDLSGNKLNGSSFEKGAFTDPSFKNIEISLNLSSNQIEYLDEDIFASFLLSGNSFYDLSNNSLNCDDLGSAWICESIKSEKIRKAIDIYGPIRCFDDRLLTDCKKNFKKRTSFNGNFNFGIKDSSPIIFLSSSTQRYENITTDKISNTSSLMTESTKMMIETTKVTQFSKMKKFHNQSSEVEKNENQDNRKFYSKSFITIFVPTVCVLIIIIIFILCIKSNSFCFSDSFGFGQVSFLEFILICITCKCFQKQKKYIRVCQKKSFEETTINDQVIEDENFSEQQGASITKYPNRKNGKSDSTKKAIEGHESIQLGFDSGESVIKTVSVENDIEYDDNNLYDDKTNDTNNKMILKISRFALTERKVQDLEDEKVLLSRDFLKVLTPEIGGGNYGKVFKGILKSSEDRSNEVAVKTLDESYMSTSSVDSFIKEGLIMKEFDHENVLSLIGIMIDYNGLPILISPLMSQDVGSFIREEKNHPTVKLLINFAIQIAQGMAYISKLKYVHRDLAARNCLLDREYATVKVADFGLSRDVYQSNFYTQKSRLAVPMKWMSPESIKDSISNHQTDVWSYGVVMWELMTRGWTPYEGLLNADLLSYLEAGKRLPCPPYCPQILYEIMRKCWNLNPKMRPTFDELVEQVKDVIVILESERDSEEKFNKKKIAENSKYAVKKFYENIN